MTCAGPRDTAGDGYHEADAGGEWRARTDGLAIGGRTARHSVEGGGPEARGAGGS
jgi:hypothetical protein